MLAPLFLVAFCSQSAPWLGDAFLACHDIEIARVEAIERVEGIPEVCLATLRIERSVWVADCKDVRTVLVHDGWDASPGPLGVGDRSVWFLVSGVYRQDEWDRAARLCLADRSFERLVCRLPIESANREPRVSLPNQDWDPIDRVPDDFPQSIGLREFEELLGCEILNRTPRIESQGNFVIESGGAVSWERHPHRSMSLAEDEMDSVLAAVERERFFDLPQILGASPCCPDAGGGRSLAVRTFAGRHWVYVRGKPDRNSTRDINACWRFERVWQSIPQRVTRGFSER